MTPQEVEFAARLARIEAAAGGRKATLYVGPDETYVFDRPLRHVKHSRLGTLLQNAGYPLSLMLCFALGCFSFCVGRYIRFQLSGVADAQPDPDVDMLIGVTTGLVVTLLIGQFDRMKASEQVVAKSLGVIFALLTFHNLVHLYPDDFGLLFSPIWVSKVIATTKPYSLVWRGISFAL